MKRVKDPFIIRFDASNAKSSRLSRNLADSEFNAGLAASQEDSVWLGKLISDKKFNLFFVCIILLFVALFSRLGYLQFKAGDYYRVMAEGNRLRSEKVIPFRGIIFDSFNQPLVENISSFTLFLNVNELNVHPEQSEEVKKIAAGLGLAENEVEKILTKESYLPVALKENLTYEQAIDLFIDINDLSSLTVQTEQLRKYPTEASLAHLLGYTGRINAEEKDQYLEQGYLLTEKIGRAGLEQYYQAELRGRLGQKSIEVDSLGREIKIIAEEAPISGSNLYLTLDFELQKKIYEILKQRIPEHAGAVVAMDPNNGQIKAFVSWPDFDSNKFSSGISSSDYQQLIDNPLKPLFNRIISGEYPSGSTIKLVMALAGLEEGLINGRTTIFSSGGIWYDKWFFPDWRAGGHGYTDVIKALADSVNTFFYYLALENFEDRQGLGLDKMLEYYAKFGLGQATGLNLYGEKSGFLPSREWKEQTKDEIWYPGDTLHLAIGQGDLLVTPLQVANYTSAVANGGTLYQPTLLDKIEDMENKVISNIQPVVIRSNLGSQENFELVRQGMRSAVTTASARGIYGVVVEVAGKTGTAQVGGEKDHHAWFTAFLPYTEPTLVLTVLVENGGEGSEAAVPIAREVIKWYEENRLK